VPGGGGGGPSAPPPPPSRPKPRPVREDCSGYTTAWECRACCERNFWDIDTPPCKNKRTSQCWINAMNLLAGCYAQCPEPVPCPCATCPCRIAIP
jgi:hypothetical protein